MSSLIKNMLGSFQGKPKEQKETGPVFNFSVEQPSLKPNGIMAVTKAEAPLSVIAEDIGAEIAFLPENGHVYIRTLTRGKTYSTEVIDPTNRNKKAVSSFIFKGLIGIHVHPAGFVLSLSEDKNFKGETRTNQPDAVITSENRSEQQVNEQRAQRIINLDLSECTELNPVIISPNNGKVENMHLVIRPHGDTFGVLLSSAKGKAREREEPSFYLKVGEQIVFDRELFADMVQREPGNIDARAWNNEIRDPIMARFSMNPNNMLTIEEMFTTDGLTIYHGNTEPIHLGPPGAKSPEEFAEHQARWAQQVGVIKQEILKGLEEKLQAEKKESTRYSLIDNVRDIIPLRNNDSVSKLAFELAIQEVLATSYGGSGGSETAMKIDQATKDLLAAIAVETLKRLDFDHIRAVVGKAVQAAIDATSGQYYLSQVETAMLGALPATDEAPGAEEETGYAEALEVAKKFFSLGRNTSRFKPIAVQLKAGVDQEEKLSLQEKVDEMAAQITRNAFQRAIVQLIVQTHFPRIEREHRKAANLPDKALTEQELDNIVKRYDAYSEYMNIAFKERIRHPLTSKIKATQSGENTEEDHRIPTKGFITYLIALRTSGGEISENTDSVPAVSPLQALPDVVPQIHIMHPDPSSSDAFVRITHRFETIAEFHFPAAVIDDSSPDEVPKQLWQAFHGLAANVMDFYLTGESNKKEDRSTHEQIVGTLSRRILLKTLNFARNSRRTPTSDDFINIEEVFHQSQLGLTTKTIQPSGDNRAEECLELLDRTKQITEPPLNLEKTLRKIVVDMQNSGVISDKTYRSKSHMRSFASAGMSKQNSNVVLPIQIDVDFGTIRINAQFNEQSFGKVIKLAPLADSGTPMGGESPAQPAHTPVENKSPEISRQKGSQAPSAAQQSSGQEADESQATKLFPIRYPLEHKELPFVLPGVKVALHSNHPIVILLDKAGKPRRQAGKLQVQRLRKKPFAISKTIQVNYVHNSIYLYSPSPYRALEAKIRGKRSNRLSLPMHGSSMAIQIIIPRKGAGDVTIRTLVNDQGKIQVAKPYSVDATGMILLNKKAGGVLPIIGCNVGPDGEGYAVRISNMMRTGIIIQSEQDHYPLNIIKDEPDDDEFDLTVLG
ncbi:MAG: hypothetical protein HQL53_08880 [Magnetococcales bacterium]|nr:hypothetical protein [Magnetococcales bacterium]